MAVNYCDGVVPDARADGPLVEHAAQRVRRAHRARSSELDFASGFGAVWELIRDANAYIEDQQPWALHKAGDAAAVAAVLGDCLEALRIVALLASPVIPHAAGRAVAPARPRPARPRSSACPTRRPGAGCPPGAALEKGAPLFPRIEATESADPRRATPRGCGHGGSTATATCHDGHRTRPTPSLDGPGRPGSTGWSAWGPTSRRSRQAVDARRGATPTCAATVGLHPHDAVAPGRASGPTLVELARTTPTGRRRSARPASTSTTSTRRATRRRPRSGPRSGSRTSSTARS